jgi:pectate lyase
MKHFSRPLGLALAGLTLSLTAAHAAPQTIPPAALALVEDSPLIKRALTEPEFFSRLDQDPAMQDDLRAKLAEASFRHFGPTRSVRVEMWRGTSTEEPMILLDHQTSFKLFAKMPAEGAVLKTPVFAGVGRDAMWHRTFYGGTEDPAAREEFEQLMAQRAAMKSNQRATLDPKFTELAEKYLPATPLPQVRDDLKNLIIKLAEACRPLGGQILTAPQYGSFGAKITDHLYLYLREFPDGAPGRSAPDPFLWLVVSGGPKTWANDYVPAFPGAEGMGARATGGRGGRVIYVTTLNPTGPGSLGEALSAKGPRTVLFKVSGQIVLPENNPDAVKITEPNLTLIGYTAPGEGIEVKGPLNIAAENVIMRGMRFRLRPPFIRDGMSTTGNLRNIIFDHCSFAYDSDEQLRMIGNGTQFLGFTIQYCLLGPGLAGIGDHPYGPEIGGYGTIHHNIFYNTLSRSPEIDCDLIDWRNNLMANLRRGHSDRPRSRVNFLGNYIVNIPGNFGADYSFDTTDAVFAAGNVREKGTERAPFEVKPSNYLRAPYTTVPITQDKPEDLEAKLVPIAGAFLPTRDSTDRYFMARFQERKSKLPYFQKPGATWKPYGNENDNPQLYELWDEANFPPPAAGAEAAPDTDGDGMPDAWETANRLNPQDPADGTQDADKDGYTNLEEFLNRTDPHKFVDYKNPKNNVHSLHPKG